jgi:hypothetical protein
MRDHRRIAGLESAKAWARKPMRIQGYEAEDVSPATRTSRTSTQDSRSARGFCP